MSINLIILFDNIKYIEEIKDKTNIYFINIEKEGRKVVTTI